MAANLTRFPNALRNAWMLLLLCASPFASAAESLPDPTRPPAEISASPTPTGQIAAPEGNRLQSIIISPTRRAAIIGGQTVELGAKHGDTRLVEVRENGVTLQGAEGRQVLALFPDVDIRKSAVLPPNEINVNKKKPVRKPVKKSVGRLDKEERK